MIRYVVLIFFPLYAFSTSIELWHAFDGYLEEVFTEIVDTFNARSKAQQVRLTKKRNYQDVIDLALHAKDKPDIFQAYEVATRTLLEKKELFRYVDTLVDSAKYIDAIANFYADSDGRMRSFPWNASTGVLFYNKDLFDAFGLSVPKTWEEVEKIGEILATKNVIGFTTSWPAAYHVEHLCSIHNVPFATKKNGFEKGLPTLIFNNELVSMHLENIKKWNELGIYTYLGRFNEAPEECFTSGKCAMLLHGANRETLMQRNAAFNIGVSELPYYSSQIDVPFAVNIGGASFWVFENLSPEKYESISAFLAYLLTPEVGAFWHQKTGYLPLTKEVYEKTNETNFYKKNPAAKIATEQVLFRKNGEFSKGIRVPNYPIIRNSILESIEKILTNDIFSKEVLNESSEKGNSIIWQK